MTKKLIFILLALLAFLSLCPSPIFMAKAEDMVYTSVSALPEKDVYYVGETVDLNIHIRNRTNETLVGVKLEFYRTIDGVKIFDNELHPLPVFYAKEQKDYTYTYTFTPEDAGTMSIASIIIFTANGEKYEEYNAKYEFTVIMSSITPAPTAEPTAEPTPSPSPTAEPATPAPNETTAHSSPNTPTPVPTVPPANGSFTQSENTFLGISYFGIIVMLVLLMALVIITALYINLLQKYKALIRQVDGE